MAQRFFANRHELVVLLVPLPVVLGHAPRRARIVGQLLESLGLCVLGQVEPEFQDQRALVGAHALVAEEVQRLGAAAAAGRGAAVVEVVGGDQEADTFGGAAVGGGSEVDEVEGCLDPVALAFGAPVEGFGGAQPSVPGTASLEDPEDAVLREGIDVRRGKLCAAKRDI